MCTVLHSTSSIIDTTLTICHCTLPIKFSLTQHLAMTTLSLTIFIVFLHLKECWVIWSHIICSLFWIGFLHFTNVHLSSICVVLWLPGGSGSKVCAYNVRDPGLIPGLGRSPGEGNGNPLQYSCLEKSHGRRSLVSYSPWGCKELDTAEWLCFHFLCCFVAWLAYIILWLNNVLSYVHATVFLAIHLLKPILNASNLGGYE